MKQQIILSPYKNFGGYDFLKLLFAEGANDVKENFKLLQCYLLKTYDRKEIDGKSIGIRLNYEDDDEVLFINDSTYYVNNNYLFPIERFDALSRLYDLEEYIKENSKQLGFLIEITGKPIFNDRHNTDSYIGLTIHDTTIPKYKRSFLKFYKSIPWKLNKILPERYHFNQHTRTSFGKYYYIIGFERTIFQNTGIK